MAKQMLVLQQKRFDLQKEGKDLAAKLEAEGRTMTDAERARFDEIKAELATVDADIARVEEVRQWEMSAAPLPTVTAEVREKPEVFGSLGEQMQAVKRFYASEGQVVDRRLMPLAGPTGASEQVGSEGGFLLQPTFQNALLMPVHETGPFSSRVRNMPVGTNSNSGTINGIDETSRATGSRWGGIRGYRLAEAGTLTATQPKFRQINWRLKKYGVLAYATDELLADTTQLEAVLNQGAGEELSFMVNDDLLNGDGAAGCLGILKCGALITVAKEAGQAADTIVAENLSKMWARMPARNKANAAWYINGDCKPQLDYLTIPMGLAGSTPHFVNYGADGILRVYGRPVIETEFNATVGDLGDIVLADMSEQLFWEKGGVQTASSIHVQFLTDQQVFRFIYRCDGQPAWASPLSPFKGSNTVSPFVALAAR